VYFNRHIFLRTRNLREIVIQDLLVLLNLVFIALLYLARLSPRLFLTYPAYSLIPLAPRSFTLVSTLIYPSLTYSVPLIYIAR